MTKAELDKEMDLMLAETKEMLAQCESIRIRTDRILKAHQAEFRNTLGGPQRKIIK